MKERLIYQNSNGGLSVQQMPDFEAALTDYCGILQEKGVPSSDISITRERIVQGNNTRSSGNAFINLVNSIKRGQNPKLF